MRARRPPIGSRPVGSNCPAGAMAAEAAAAPPRRVQVCVRLRPSPPGEDPCLLPLDSHTLQLREDPPHAPSCYRFDAVYDDASSTAAVYEGSVRPLLAQFLAGRDVTVLAYGPSGSGKTHTMLGGEGEPGLVQRALEELLQALGASRPLSVACMEVYCEEVRDLLAPGGPPLRILQPRGGPPEVRGLTRLPLSPPPAPSLLVASLGARRCAAPTLLNPSSSRGHLVLWVRCEPLPGAPSPMPGGPTLTLADLAGLEDPRQSGAGGARLREGGATNASLGVLRRVLGALRRGGRPPLRESRLTRLLGGVPNPSGPPPSPPPPPHPLPPPLGAPPGPPSPQLRPGGSPGAPPPNKLPWGGRGRDPPWPATPQSPGPPPPRPPWRTRPCSAGWRTLRTPCRG
ncbi:kinesin-like protein KIF22 [Anas acuta]|uniref:kinesin-like protein KIF22 n=1 Tax=Anas acuta TaxID=28680 RepID=UPI0035C893C7